MTAKPHWTVLAIVVPAVLAATLLDGLFRVWLDLAIAVALVSAGGRDHGRRVAEKALTRTAPVLHCNRYCRSKFQESIMLRISLCLVAGLLGACAPAQPQRFTHASATQQIYMQDRFACIQAAQRPYSGAYVNAYGGSANSGVYTSRGVFTACMGAKGYLADEKGSLVTPPGHVIQMGN